ncbi:MAG: peptide-modifying radical SAM enzyme CbpB, partial [Chloroflexi bacterium]|nr:peptide-modifying radical SAM enzyme CbpB [Chloroflexota bacterium]
MFDNLFVDETEFKIDPETNFWGTGNTEKLAKLYSQMQPKLAAEIRDLRYSTDIILFYVNPTDRCNANCPYCYLPQEVKSRGKNMTYPELQAIVEKASAFFKSQNKKGSVIFHGTEPLLNKDNLFQIIKDYHNDLFFGLQTNGLLLTEADVAFIKEYNVNIGVSIDSPVEETNDFLRGSGHYRKIMDALDWFKGYRGLNVVTTITTYNVNQLTDMVRLLHSKDVRLCLMNPVRGTQQGALALRPEPLTAAKEFINAVEEAIRLTKEGKRIVVADFANVLLGIIAPSARVMMCDISPCGGGRRYMAVAANGTAYPCGEFIGMDAFVGGNIFTDTVESIVSSGNFQKVTKRTVDNIPECQTCMFRNMCGSPCPAEMHSTDPNAKAI